MAGIGRGRGFMTGMALILGLTAVTAWSGVIQAPLGQGQDGDNTVQYQLTPQISTQQNSGKKQKPKAKQKMAPMPDMKGEQPAMPAMQIRGNATVDPKFKSMNPGGSVQIKSSQPGVQLHGHTQMDTGLAGGVQHKSDGHDNRNNMNIGGMQNQ